MRYWRKTTDSVGTDKKAVVYLRCSRMQLSLDMLIPSLSMRFDIDITLYYTLS